MKFSCQWKGTAPPLPETACLAPPICFYCAPANLNCMQRVLVFVFLGSFVFQTSLSAQSTNQFEFLDGDRVVLLGDTLIEREQSYSHIEYLLATQFPDRHVTFRN